MSVSESINLTGSKIFLIRDSLLSVGEELSQRGTEPQYGLKTLPVLNRMIWGIQPKKLYVIGARTSQGKSSLVLQIAWDLALQKHEVLFISLEMTIEEMVERLFCMSCEVNNEKLLTGRFKDHAKEWGEFHAQVASMPLVLSEGIGKTWKDIQYLLDQISTKPKVIILDYIQCIKGVGLEKREAIDEYIRQFRQMAIEYNFTAILCSQVNRAGIDSKEKVPGLHHLKDSGFLEEHADKVILLHYPYAYEKTEEKFKYVMIVAKNRNGQTGPVEIYFKPQFYRFYDRNVEDDNPPIEAKETADMFDGKVLRGYQKVTDWQ